MKIGIFGGAFDPPHRGHEKAAMTFLEGAQLDLLYIIPSGDPPHKIISSGSSAKDRLSMCKAAFCSLSDKVLVSDIEICSKEKSYSYLTVDKISKRHPDSEIFLFVGTDQFLAFETWREFQYLLSACTLCVMDRFEDREVLWKKKASLEKEFGARCLIFEEKPYIISSTAIREELKEDGFSSSLSPFVNDYITKEGLYSSDFDSTREKAVKKVVETLSDNRLSHTFSVERETLCLAKIFSLPEEEKKQLALGALFHDLTKYWTFEENESFLLEKGERLTKEDRLSPQVLHGRSASYLAAEEFDLSDEVRSAIYYHTTGKEDMTLYEKILFFADFIEETRTHTVCGEMREYFYSHLPEKREDRLSFLDSCILRVLEQTVGHLKEKNQPIHPATLKALVDLKER